MKMIMMTLVLNVQTRNVEMYKLPPPEIKQKLDQVYYYFNCVDLNIELQ